MGLRARLAATAPVPVFPMAGAGAREAVLDLHLRPELTLVDTPRAADVLLVAGNLASGSVAGTLAIHDQLPPPRVTVRWGGSTLEGLPFAHRIDGGEDEVVAALVDIHRRTLSGELSSEPPVLPDLDPVEWRGVGPYGQGGKGMTGGTPYGRPLAERAPDRDGLELDQLILTIGPWLPIFPPGLALEVKLAGDLIREVELGPSPLSGVAHPPDIFQASLAGPVRVADLEMARSRHHLRRLAEALRVHDLESLAFRTLRLAKALRAEDREAVEDLARRIERSRLYRWVLEGVGVVDPGQVVGLGPVARASGIPDDARLDDPAYRALGFEPLTLQGGDAATRWRQRLKETMQALDLAARSGDRTTGGIGVVESPRGRLAVGEPYPATRLLGLIPSTLSGLEWGDAVATLLSLDLEPVESEAEPAVAAVGEPAA